MDLSKYPIEKLFQFAAGIIPGSAALLIFESAHPGSVSWLLSLDLLGYKTRLGVILFLAFILGNTMSTFLNAIAGGIGGIVGQKRAQVPYQLPHTFVVAPWRDRLWRIALKNFLGSDAPEDTLLMTEETFQQRKKMIAAVPSLQGIAGVPMFQGTVGDLELEKLTTEINDSKWMEWYDHFHRVVQENYNRDFIFHVRTGLSYNMETTGLLILISALLTPTVRHWWYLLPACVWTLLLCAEVYNALKNASNRWSTLFQQVDYLTKIRRPPQDNDSPV